MSSPIIGTCWLSGKTTMCVTLAPALREQLQLLPKDVLAFRVIIEGGRRFLVGEKINMNKLASLPDVSREVVKKAKE